LVFEDGASPFGLQPEMNFENFVGGKANGLALHSSLQFVEVGSNLLIYGGPGLGKTHLLHAIGNQFIVDNPEARVRYIRGSQYVSMVAGAFQRKKFDQLRSYFAGLDLLLFDDVQKIARKPASQAVLIDMLDHCGSGNQKIVFACDGQPNKVFIEEPRLASRIAKVLSIKIEKPRRTLRLRILRQASSEMCLTIEESAIRYVAEHDWNNVMELQGALRRVKSYVNFHERYANM
jgi:chromosomal replication initiator protein